MTQGDVSSAEWRQTLLTVWMPWACPEYGRRLYLKLKVVIELTVVFKSRRMKLYLGWHWDESMSRLQFQLIRIPIAAPWEDTHLYWLVAQKKAALLCSDITHKCGWWVWWNCPWWKIICNFSGMLLESAVWVCSYIMWPMLCEYVAILCSMYLSVRTHTYRNICPY